MSIETDLQQRSNHQCELCSSPHQLRAYPVPASPSEDAEHCVLLCETCRSQLADLSTNTNHWRCLNDSMWSQVPAVQVMAWRILSELSAEGWPQDLLDMLYLEDDTLAWAKAGINETDDTALIHKDSNGAVLTSGDTVTLTKDLTVKGANFTAKRGTAVRNIHLVANNAEHIEGKVNGQQIVILTKFVKKA